MSHTNDSVFPKTGYGDGLTKRERFAAMAMQGICSDWPQPHTSYDDVAVMAVMLADALIRALNKDAGEL